MAPCVITPGKIHRHGHGFKSNGKLRFFFPLLNQFTKLRFQLIGIGYIGVPFARGVYHTKFGDGRLLQN